MGEHEQNLKSAWVDGTPLDAAWLEALPAQEREDMIKTTRSSEIWDLEEVQGAQLRYLDQLRKGGADIIGFDPVTGRYERVEARFLYANYVSFPLATLSAPNRSLSKLVVCTTTISPPEDIGPKATEAELKKVWGDFQQSFQLGLERRERERKHGLKHLVYEAVKSLLLDQKFAIHKVSQTKAIRKIKLELKRLRADEFPGNSPTDEAIRKLIPEYFPRWYDNGSQHFQR
jgi:hypothetical protein